MYLVCSTFEILLSVNLVIKGFEKKFLLYGNLQLYLNIRQTSLWKILPYAQHNAGAHEKQVWIYRYSCMPLYIYRHVITWTLSKSLLEHDITTLFPAIKAAQQRLRAFGVNSPVTQPHTQAYINYVEMS